MIYKPIPKKFAVYLIIIFLLLSRFLYLDSDTVTIPQLMNQDEGNYTSNIRNLVVTGSAINDETNFFLLTPVFSASQYIFLKSFGIHIWSSRIVNVIYSILTILLGSLVLKKFYSNKTALILLTLLGTDFLYLIHSRIAIPEVTQIFWYSLALLLIGNAIDKNKKHLYFISGLISAMAILSKTSGSSILILYLFFTLSNIVFNYQKIIKNKINFILNNILFMLGLIIPIGLWWIFMIAPNYIEFSIVKRNLIDMHRPYIKGALIHTWFWKSELVEFIQGGEGLVWKYTVIPLLLAVAQIIKSIKQKTLYSERVVYYSSIWLLSGFAYFLIINYKPARWFVINLIPIYILASIYITNIKQIYIKYFLILAILVFNLYYSLKYVYYSPNYKIKKASIELNNIVKNNTVVGESLLHLENNSSLVYNIYFMEGKYSHSEISELLKETNYPKYTILNNDFIRYLPNRKYNLIKKIIYTINGNETQLYIFEYIKKDYNKLSE